MKLASFLVLGLLIGVTLARHTRVRRNIAEDKEKTDDEKVMEMLAERGMLGGGLNGANNPLALWEQFWSNLLQGGLNGGGGLGDKFDGLGGLGAGGLGDKFDGLGGIGGGGGGLGDKLNGLFGGLGGLGDKFNGGRRIYTRKVKLNDQ